MGIICSSIISASLQSMLNMFTLFLIWELRVSFINSMADKIPPAYYINSLNLAAETTGFKLFSMALCILTEVTRNIHRTGRTLPSLRGVLTTRFRKQAEREASSHRTDHVTGGMAWAGKGLDSEWHWLGDRHVRIPPFWCRSFKRFFIN